MFIVWGTKVIDKRLGRAADYCPLCRDVRGFQATRVESVGHVYYIPLGKREILGFRKKCETCRLTLVSQQEEFDAYSRDRHEEVESLIENTNPHVYSRHEQRLDWAKRARNGTLLSEERLAMIREPFLLLAPTVEKQGSSIEFDRASGLGCLGTFLLPVCLFIAASEMHGSFEDPLAKAGVVVGALMALLTLYLLATSGGRHTKRILIPQLTRALGMLQPTLEELEETVGWLKASKLRIGKRIKPLALFEAIQLENQGFPS